MNSRFVAALQKEREDGLKHAREQVASMLEVLVHSRTNAGEIPAAATALYDDLLAHMERLEDMLLTIYRELKTNAVS